MDIEGIIFVQSTEMEKKFSACIYKNNIVKQVFYNLYASDVKSIHTHVKCFVCGVKFCLRGEGRREGEGME